MRIKKSIILALIIILIAGIIMYIGPRLPILTGYAAKGMCSCVFVSNRTPENIKKTDLSFFPIKLASYNIDYDKKMVTSAVFGLSKMKAIYKEGYGCVLMNDISEKEIIQQQRTKIPVYPYDNDTIIWPTGNILPHIDSSTINFALMDSLVEEVFDHPDSIPTKKTTALIIVHKGNIILERYAEDFNSKTPGIGWSMTKSMIGSFVGLLNRDSLINIYKPVEISAWNTDIRNQITLDNLLHMNSGLNWTENYFNISDVTKMLYREGDTYAYAIKSKYQYTPGEKWMYSSGTPNIISGYIRQILHNDSIYHTYLYHELFHPLGMSSITLETDVTGNFVGSSYSYATARDWARYGLLYLNKGNWQGEQIIPANWVTYSTQAIDSCTTTYGALFWLYDEHKIPDAPKDTYYCDGFLGQRIYIIPSQSLVIVRLGYSSQHIDFNRMIVAVAKAVKNPSEN